MADTINVGVIGTGMGRLHLRGYAKVPDVKILGVCDINEADARRFAQEYGAPHAVTDYHDLLKIDGLDAVSVCTPNFLHAPMSIDALNAGLHVLCEKPMATSAADAKRMLAAAKKARRRLMIGMSLRFESSTQPAYDLAVVKGELGKVYYCRACMIRTRAFAGTFPKDGSMARGPWFANKQQAGGGALYDIGVHTFDCAWWLMGRPSPAYVTARTYLEIGPEHYRKHGVPVDVEELATAMVKFENGATMLLDVSWGLNAKKHFDVQVMGTKAGVDLTPALYHDGPDGKFVAEPLTAPPAEQVESEWAHFIACIRDPKRPCKSPAEDGVVVMRVLDAIYAAAAADKQVRVKK
jgi:predicted dehydrogenase